MDSLSGVSNGLTNEKVLPLSEQRMDDILFRYFDTLVHDRPTLKCNLIGELEFR
jgi:hypothetical protein